MKTRMTRWIYLIVVAVVGTSYYSDCDGSTIRSNHDDDDDDHQQPPTPPPPPDASCRPPRGETYLAIGQDLLSVADYLLVQYNATLHEAMAASTTSATVSAAAATATTTAAAAFMVYTDIQHLRGLEEPVDYGSGIEYADGFWEGHGGSVSSSSHHATNALQIGLWLNGTTGCRDVLQGRLTRQVQRLLAYCMKGHSSLPTRSTASSSPQRFIFLRVGYEFDNPSFGYLDSVDDNGDNNSNNNNNNSSAGVYAQAFRFLVDACHEQYSKQACRDQIAFVWHSWGATDYSNHHTNDDSSSSSSSRNQLDDFYPGDDYVDWIGVSLFSQVYPPINDNENGSTTVPAFIPRLGTMDTVRIVLDYAQHHTKPIMIAESTPFGGMDVLRDPWNDWFVPVLQLMDDYDIAMWSYIHCDWESQPLWHTVGFGDSRLSTNATVLHLWRRYVLNATSRFTSQLSCRRRQQGRDSDTTDATTTTKSSSSTKASRHSHTVRTVHVNDDDDEDDDKLHHSMHHPHNQVETSLFGDDELELLGLSSSSSEATAPCCSCKDETAHVKIEEHRRWPLLLLLLYPMGCFVCIYLFLYHFIFPWYGPSHCRHHDRNDTWQQCPPPLSANDWDDNNQQPAAAKPITNSAPPRSQFSYGAIEQ